MADAGSSCCPSDSSAPEAQTEQADVAGLGQSGLQYKKLQKKKGLSGSPIHSDCQLWQLTRLTRCSALSG